MNKEHLYELLDIMKVKKVKGNNNYKNIKNNRKYDPPNELLEWYEIISQYEIEQTHEMLPGWYIATYEYAYSSYEVITKMNMPKSIFKKYIKKFFGMELNVIDEYWNSFMLLTDYSNGGCGIGSKNTNYAGKIIAYEIDSPWQIAFENINKMLETAIECRKSNVWYNDMNDVNWNTYYHIANKINIGNSRWKEME